MGVQVSSCSAQTSFGASRAPPPTMWIEVAAHRRTHHSRSQSRVQVCNRPSLFFRPRGGWRFLNHLILHLRCKITAFDRTACHKSAHTLLSVTKQSSSPHLLLHKLPPSVAIATATSLGEGGFTPLAQVRKFKSPSALHKPLSGRRRRRPLQCGLRLLPIFATSSVCPTGSHLPLKGKASLPSVTKQSSSLAIPTLHKSL